MSTKKDILALETEIQEASSLVTKGVEAVKTVMEKIKQVIDEDNEKMESTSGAVYARLEERIEKLWETNDMIEEAADEIERQNGDIFYAHDNILNN